jgi:AcrR family transcriptional regulator
LQARRPVAQVLVKEGAPRFTTARVAEKAGVSVRSLYQYFPNKAAILFRLESDEWRRTSELLRAILEDVSKSPLERLHTLVHTFIRSECDEAAMLHCAGLYARSAARGPGIDARLGRQPHHDDAKPSGKAFLGKP